MIKIWFSKKLVYLGGFKYFVFSPLPGEMIQFDYFSNGLKPPISESFGRKRMAGNKTLTQYIQMYLTGYNLWEFWPRFFVSLVDPGPRWGVSIHGSFPESERCVDGFPFSLALGTRFIFCGQTVLLVIGGAATFFWGWPTRNGEGRAGDAEWNHMEITKSLFLVEIQTSHTPVAYCWCKFPWNGSLISKKLMVVEVYESVEVYGSVEV